MTMKNCDDIRFCLTNYVNNAKNSYQKSNKNDLNLIQILKCECYLKVKGQMLNEL